MPLEWALKNWLVGFQKVVMGMENILDREEKRWGYGGDIWEEQTVYFDILLTHYV